MSKLDIEELLDRYLDGKATPMEIERVEAWLNQQHNPASEWQQMDGVNRDRWLTGVFDVITTEVGFNKGKVIAIHSSRVLWRSIAAIAALLIICSGLYLAWPIFQNHLSNAPLVALSVPENQKKQMVLADGSKVWINSLSELKYPEKFDGATREVFLTGEAYFDIRHDAARPFLIHTGKVITRVLGTAFNIKEDCKLHTVTVTVTRGKVSVANGGEPIGVITPNQQISYNTSNNQHSKQTVDAQKVVAWQNRDIRFDDITFADAALQLQQRFKVKISFANDRVKNCRFTGTALQEEKLDKILKVICAFNKASYQTKADGSIVIDGPGCN